MDFLVINWWNTCTGCQGMGAGEQQADDGHQAPLHGAKCALILNV